VLAIDLHPRHFGYVVVENPGRLLDWGVPARKSRRAASTISSRLTPPAPTDWPKKLAYAFSSNAVSSDGDPAC
jgi:hypothetical protein